MSDNRVNKELVIVSFDEFGQNSLNLFIYFYTNIMDFLDYKKKS